MSSAQSLLRTPATYEASVTTTDAPPAAPTVLPSTRHNPAIAPLTFERVREKTRGAVTLRYFSEEETLADRWLELYHTSLPVVESFLDAPLEGKVTLELVGTGRFGTNPLAGVVQVSNKLHAEDKPLLDAAELGYQLGRILWYRASSDKNYLAMSQNLQRRQKQPNPFAGHHIMDVDKAQRSPDWLLDAALLPLKHIWSNLATWETHLKEQLECYLKTNTPLNTISSNYSELSIDSPELAQALATLRGQSISQRCPDWQRRVSRALSIDFELNGVAALNLVTRTSLSEWEAIFVSDLERWQRDWC